MPGPNSNVTEIVSRFLDASSDGFGGLFNEAIGCCCVRDDLAPCGEMQGDCEAGFVATRQEAEELGLEIDEPDSPFFITRVSPRTLSADQ